MTPEELLFKNPQTKIYESQKELAERIIVAPKSAFSNIKIDSFKSLLSKTIRGERRLSPKLRDAIEHAIDSDAQISQEKSVLVKARLKESFDEAFNDYTTLKKFEKEDRISTKLFIDLELYSKGVEVNCITSNLNWAVEHIDGIIESAKNNSSTYKYLVFDFQAERNISIMEKIVKEENLSDRIQIKRVYKKLGFYKIEGKEFVDTYSILFPSFEDLVIYKNIPQKFRDSFKIKNTSIVVMGSTIYNEDYDRLYDDFILDDGSRINATENWFNSIWDACE
jgi:transcriptional regulator with XRE-family HTH domain